MCDKGRKEAVKAVKVLGSGRTFVCDVMLKKLSRWLRLFGIKVIYAGDYTSEDDAIIRLALERGATLLTSDSALAAKAADYVPTHLINARGAVEQIVDVLNSYKLRIKPWPSTVCPTCGSTLKRVKKKCVEEAAPVRVSARILARHRLFWLCRGCGKVYWPGSHWKGIKATIATVRKKLKKMRKG